MNNTIKQLPIKTDHIDIVQIPKLIGIDKIDTNDSNKDL